MILKIYSFSDSIGSKALRTDFDSVCMNYLLVYIQSKFEEICNRKYNLNHSLSSSQIADVLVSCYKEHFAYCENFNASEIVEKTSPCGYNYDYFYNEERYEEFDTLEIWEEYVSVTPVISTISFFECEELNLMLYSILEKMKQRTV